MGLAFRQYLGLADSWHGIHGIATALPSALSAIRSQPSRLGSARRSEVRIHMTHTPDELLDYALFLAARMNIVVTHVPHRLPFRRHDFEIVTWKDSTLIVRTVEPANELRDVARQVPLPFRVERLEGLERRAVIGAHELDIVLG